MAVLRQAIATADLRHGERARTARPGRQIIFIPALSRPLSRQGAGRLRVNRGGIAAALVGLLVLAASCGGGAVDEATSGQGVEPVGGDMRPAPEFELALFANDEHAAGEVISLSQFEGQPVVLNFWFPSCPPCVAEMPDFEEAYQRFKPDGVQFIGVQLLGLDTAEDGQKFVERLDVNYALGADERDGVFGDIVKDYRVSGFPTTVFIDRDHNIRRTWVGALNVEKLEELVREVL